jgi:hypothetical protein
MDTETVKVTSRIWISIKVMRIRNNGPGKERKYLVWKKEGKKAAKITFDFHSTRYLFLYL